MVAHQTQEPPEQVVLVVAETQLKLPAQQALEQRTPVAVVVAVVVTSIVLAVQAAPAS